jgi:hypothetical protein
MLGGVIFGVLSVWLAYRLIGQIKEEMRAPRAE